MVFFRLCSKEEVFNYLLSRHIKKGLDTEMVEKLYKWKLDERNEKPPFEVPTGFIEEYEGIKIGLNFDTFPELDETRYNEIYDHPNMRHTLKDIAKILAISYIQRNIDDFLNGKQFIPYYDDDYLIETINDEKLKLKHNSMWLTMGFGKKGLKEELGKIGKVVMYPSYMEEYGCSKKEINEHNTNYMFKKLSLTL